MKIIEAPEGSAAVAASEVVAAAAGRPAFALPDAARSCLVRLSAASAVQLTPKAIEALKRVTDPKASELHQLWAEGKRLPVWLAEVQSLATRLAQVASQTR